MVNVILRVILSVHAAQVSDGGIKMYYNRTFELLQNVHVPSQLAYLSISVTLWVVLTGRVATIIMAVLFLLCVELWMKLFLYLNRIQYIEIILVC